MLVLVINAGSSSLKYQLIDTTSDKVKAKGLVERIGSAGANLAQGDIVIKKNMPTHKEAIAEVLNALQHPEYGAIKDISEISAVGHRVVHGAEKFKSSVIIDDKVMKALDACIDLAPLHNPPNITGIRACSDAMPGVPQIAVFDTAFHQTMTPEAYIYAIPYHFYEDYKIRRYGFHGTSHKYVSAKAAEIIGKPLSELKIITAHLGNGSSLAAVKNGKSIDTSMGFTPLAGVVMGTRSGDIDPAIVAFIAEREKLSASEAVIYLNKKGGLLGISGTSNDIRDIHKSSEEGDERARLAFNIFVYGVKKYIGAYAAAMGGVDVLIFTAGIGENDYLVRDAVTQNLDFLGIKIDRETNHGARGFLDLTAPDAAVKTMVIPTNEELMIARETADILNQ